MKSMTYVVEITLTVDAGIDSLPDTTEAEDLIATQMSGELDDPVENGGTGLFCSCVTVLQAIEY